MTMAVRAPGAVGRKYLAAGTFVGLGLVNILIFGLFAHRGDAVFGLSLAGEGIQVPSIRVPAALLCYVLGAICIGLGILRATTPMSGRANRFAIGGVLLCFMISLLAWADAGNSLPLNMINLMQGTFAASIPLVLGALAGCMCERSGVINIAIEGQLILGAFVATAVASGLGALWVGLISGSLAAGLLGAVLAAFAIKYLVDQIIVGVVLNVLALGLTAYFYNRVVANSQTLNNGLTFSTMKIPVLGHIPIIGPIFFDSTIFLYLTYSLIIVVQVGLFSTRWGLRARAVGEHPTAADTVGIKVTRVRYRNVILGGMVAGVGGAYLTIGSVGYFTPGMSSGFGYIALAAMIFGRWKPLGAVAAALLFGFARNLGPQLETLKVPLSIYLLQMAPYLATIIAVAGLVGRVRAPAADGKPYVKA